MTTRTLLVVDDQKDILDLVRLAIDVTAAWTVLTVESVEEAAATAAGTAVDAILLDLSVTDDDPRGAVARLAAAPVILLTAMTLPQSAVEQTAAAGYIAKPFDPMTLADEISQILGWEQP